MTIEQEIKEAVAWLEIDRLTERILRMKPRSFSRNLALVQLSRLMSAKLNRENQTPPPAHYEPSSLKYRGRAA